MSEADVGIGCGHGDGSRRRRGRTVAIASAAAAVVTLGVAAFPLRDRLLVEWHLRRLETGDEAARILAAERLGEMRAVRAASLLTQALLQDAAAYLRRLKSRSRDGSVRGSGDPDQHLSQLGRACKQALITIGAPATPTILQAMLQDEQDELEVVSTGHLSAVLIAVHETADTVPTARSRPISVEEIVLTALKDDPAQPGETRRLAALVLEKRYRR